MFTLVYLCLLRFTSVYLYLPLFTRVYLIVPRFSRARLHIFAHDYSVYLCLHLLNYLRYILLVFTHFCHCSLVHVHLCVPMFSLITYVYTFLSVSHS